MLPRMRWVSDPASDARLAELACGGESEHERDVEKALDELRGLSVEDAAEYEIRVAEARHADDLIAVSVFHKLPLGDSEEFADAVCLRVIAINEPYRRCCMPDGATGIGTFLLCDTLAQVNHLWGNPMPYVWGVVHQNNKDCQNVLNRHKFWRLKDSKRDPSRPYFVHLRQDHLDWDHGFSPRILNTVDEAST
jgi:hypothetical protein